MAAVETVLGQVEASGLGVTLPHEHLFINLMRERRGDGLINDEALVVEEVSIFHAQGGRTIVDLSTHDLTAGSTLYSRGVTVGRSRNPENVEAIARVSRTSGLHIVLGTGHYRDPYLDHDYFDTHSVDEIADGIVRDLKEAIPGTDVRAGVIGEIGSDKWYISAREERSFRAAARAAVRTNAGLYTHAARWPVGRAQLDLLAEESVAPDRVAVGHVDTVPEADYALALARRGVYVGIDTMFDESPRAIALRVDLVLRLVQAGFGNRILLSQDVCVSSQLRAGGGPGFGLIHGTFKTSVLAAGLDEGLFRSITTVNPTRFLTG